MVDRYGAYLNHLLALIEDPSVKSDDRAKLKGYVQKWKQPRMLIGECNEKQAGVVKCGDAALHSCILGYIELGDN